MSDNIKILKRYLLYFLTFLLVCIIGVSGVFADTFTPSSALQYYEYYQGNTKKESSVNYGSNIMLGSPDSTNYPYAMSLILYGSYIQGKTYTLNANVSTYFESNYFKFYYENLNYLIVNAQLVNGTNRTLCNIQPITQNSSYTISCTFEPTSNLNQIVLSLVNYDYQNNGYVPFGSGDYVKFTNYNMAVYDNSSDILINQNEIIINQNNQNTQNIINNQNDNTDRLIEDNKKNFENCIDEITVNPSFSSSRLTTNNGGSVQPSSANDSGAIIDVSKYQNKTIEIVFSNLDRTKNARTNYCFTDKLANNEVKCISSSITTIFSLSKTYIVDVPDNAKYLYLLGYVGSEDLSWVNNVTVKFPEICINRLQEQTEAITGLNDSLNDADSTGATSEASEFFSSFTTNTFGLTSIITAPLNLIQSLSSSSCSDLHLPLPYLSNKYLDLPCMTTIYQTHFGAFFTMYQTITYGIIAYWVCVRIFNQVKDFKNPEHDEIEVVDL